MRIKELVKELPVPRNVCDGESHPTCIFQLNKLLDYCRGGSTFNPLRFEIPYQNSSFVSGVFQGKKEER